MYGFRAFYSCIVSPFLSKYWHMYVHLNIQCIRYLLYEKEYFSSHSCIQKKLLLIHVGNWEKLRSRFLVSLCLSRSWSFWILELPLLLHLQTRSQLLQHISVSIPYMMYYLLGKYISLSFQISLVLLIWFQILTRRTDISG